MHLHRREPVRVRTASVLRRPKGPENRMSLNAATFVCNDTTLFASPVSSQPESEQSIVAEWASGDARGEKTLRLTPKYGSHQVEVRVRYRWQGAAGAPTVVVQGGISASRDVAGSGDGWWAELVGAGRAVDLTHLRVLSIDWLSTSDLAGASAVSSEDQADALAALCTSLGVEQIEAFIGASYGAMTGIALAARHPQRVARVVAISGTHRAHPLSTALRSIQREIVRGGLRNGDVAAALGLARQLAMTTYRGAEEFAQRFDAAPDLRDGRFYFPVEDYLSAAGRKFVGRFDAQRYLALSESIDLHRLDPAAIRAPLTVVAVSSDRLVPVEDSRALADVIGADYHEIDSIYGHDAFLKEPAQIGAILRDALCY